MNSSSTKVSFCKVYVGPLGYPVWIIDSKHNVYVREGVENNLPIGKKWILVPELPAQELCISKHAVWLLSSSGKIYRRFGISEKNPCGDYWKQIPGNMNYISVTEGDDLWGLKDEAIFVHSSFALKNSQSSNSKKLPTRSISEDDWEDIMAEMSDND
ncbi:Tectonin beta-propeller repeat-containing protein 2, partial [Stegodyphus mimosarum]